MDNEDIQALSLIFGNPLKKGTGVAAILKTAGEAISTILDKTKDSEGNFDPDAFETAADRLIDLAHTAG